MKEENVAIRFHYLLAVSQNMLESYELRLHLHQNLSYLKRSVGYPRLTGMTLLRTDLHYF